MNRNDYRRALIMLRSLKTGVSGYVRLERRTLMGTLQFTVNGVQDGSRLYAALLYEKGGSWSGVRLAEFGSPRSGQTGLVWKFDPRNIEGRTLEQYRLAAVVEIRNGICDLILSGNLNGSTEVDWAMVREAACRLFSPVRISGAPIPPIAEREEPNPEPPVGDQPQILPELGEETPAYPGTDDSAAPSGSSCGCHEESSDSLDSPAGQQASMAEVSAEPTVPEDAPSSDSIARGEPDTAHGPEAADSPSPDETDLPADADDLDIPAQSSDPVPDELDAPAVETGDPDETDIPAAGPSSDSPYNTPARRALYESSPTVLSDDEPDDFTPAGSRLSLSDPEAPWPECIRSLQSLFFSSEADSSLDMDGYVFIRLPLPEETGVSTCLAGISCSGGVPSAVCYAIPASAPSAEPPAGLEDYVWQSGGLHGYWTICESVR